jgi:hypothetical protein
MPKRPRRAPSSDRRRRTPRVPVSWGELFDKLAILEIKCERITDAPRVNNVRKERAALQRVVDRLDKPPRGLKALRAALRGINAELWRIEDDIRAKEAGQAFDAEFVALARAVYRTNDERARIKREINLLLASELIEEKQYAPYRAGR